MTRASLLALGFLLAAGSGTHAQQPVKIGVLTDMQSAYADFAGKGSVLAAQMAIEDFGGTVLGKPIELLSADHQNKADVAASIARRWYDADGVDVIIDLTNSAVAIAVQDITKEKRKINLTTSTVTTAITNEKCSPYGVHWTLDAYSISAGAARAMVAEGGKSWYFITVNYTFGHNLEATATGVLNALGGKSLGDVQFPLNNADFSSHLLQAQKSGAEVIGLAAGGNDVANLIKQAQEFGIMRKQKVSALLLLINDVHSMGLENAQGLIAVEAFYWDRTDESRAWAQRFFKRHGQMPSSVHAGAYSAVTHYLKAVKALGTKDTDKVMAKMRSEPINDMAWTNAYIREDGRMVHDMYLVQVKSPAESKGPWDYYKVLRTIPAEQAFLPLSESKCPLVKK